MLGTGGAAAQSWGLGGVTEQFGNGMFSLGSKFMEIMTQHNVCLQYSIFLSLREVCEELFP